MQIIRVMNEMLENKKPVIRKSRYLTVLRVKMRKKREFEQYYKAFKQEIETVLKMPDLREDKIKDIKKLNNYLLSKYMTPLVIPITNMLLINFYFI